MRRKWEVVLVRPDAETPLVVRHFWRFTRATKMVDFLNHIIGGQLDHHYEVRERANDIETPISSWTEDPHPDPFNWERDDGIVWTL